MVEVKDPKFDCFSSLSSRYMTCIRFCQLFARATERGRSSWFFTTPLGKKNKKARPKSACAEGKGFVAPFKVSNYA